MVLRSAALGSGREIQGRRQPPPLFFHEPVITKGQFMDEHAKGEQRIAELLHELRQPLNTIILSCSNMQNRARLQKAALSADFILTKTDSIINSVHQSAIIIDQIEKIHK